MTQRFSSPASASWALPRLAVSKAEASEMLGCSVDWFEEYVQPEIRCVRGGRNVLVPVRKLERWLDRNAARVLS